MIAGIFSHIWKQAVRLSGKIDSPGLDFTNCQNGDHLLPTVGRQELGHVLKLRYHFQKNGYMPA